MTIRIITMKAQLTHNPTPDKLRTRATQIIIVSYTMSQDGVTITGSAQDLIVSLPYVIVT